jgi:hypothetical protein
MSPKRVCVRLAAIVPFCALVACSQEDVNQAIGDWIKSALWFVAKMILISLALLVAWAAAAVAGGALIFAGVRRRKIDAVSVLLMLFGIGCVVGAWPLVFSQQGLAGVMAPGSTSNVTAGPIVGQALAVLGVVIAATVLTRRYRAKRAASVPAVPAAAMSPPAPPPVPPAPPKLAPAPVIENVSVAKPKTAPRKRSPSRSSRPSSAKRPTASTKKPPAKRIDATRR